MRAAFLLPALLFTMVLHAQQTVVRYAYGPFGNIGDAAFVVE